MIASVKIKQKKVTTVKQIYGLLDQMAPFETQEDFDNAGFQVGSKNDIVSKILICLDVTTEIINEAKDLGAELIISHHPLIFSSLKNIDTDYYVPNLVMSLIKNNICLISGHTNVDQSPDLSPGFAVARMLDLKNIRREGLYVFLGELRKPILSNDLKDQLVKVLEAPVRMYSDANDLITTLAIAGGAYSEGFYEAKAAGAQAFLTGEVRHHHAIEAVNQHLTLFEGGHLATETPMLPLMALSLQKSMDTLEYNVRVFVSSRLPYRIS